MKRIAILALLSSLFFANIADARFSDEYRAKYPKRVKVETKISPNGQQVKMMTYTLFTHYISAGWFQMRVYDYDGIKLCSITYGETVSTPKDYSHFSWGDGKEEHEIGRLVSYYEREGRGRYHNFMTATIQPSDLKKAVVLSTHYNGYFSDPILHVSNKYWKEWMEALDIAEKLIKEER